MRETSDEARYTVELLLEHCSVLPIKLVELVLMNKFYPNIQPGYVYHILRQMQYNGKLFMTEDDYVMTTSAYLHITGDYFYDKIKRGTERKVCEPTDLSNSRDGKELIDCMWFLASMMPNVKNIFTDNDELGCLWNLQFIVPETDKTDARLFQVAKFGDGLEVVKKVLIENAGREDNHIIRSHIRRVALFDDETMVGYVPQGVGFNTIAVVDEEEPRHFRVIETIPVNEAWK